MRIDNRQDCRDVRVHGHIRDHGQCPGLWNAKVQTERGVNCHVYHRHAVAIPGRRNTVRQALPRRHGLGLLQQYINLAAWDGAGALGNVSRL